MTFKQAYLFARRALKAHRCSGSDSAREAELFVAFAARAPRETLWTRPEKIFPAAARRKLSACLRRRLGHEPVEYITGQGACYGLQLAVSKQTLIPRPATEIIIAAALRRASETEPDLIVDVGTGSGCIALALAANHGAAPIVATDTSASALRLARANARRLGFADRIAFAKGDLIAPAMKALGAAKRPLIVANLPYIPASGMAKLPREVRDFEPRIALDGGRDGLDAYRAVLAQIKAILSRNGSAGRRLDLFFEILPRQYGPLASLLKKNFPGSRAGKILSSAKNCLGFYGSIV